VLDLQADRLSTHYLPATNCGVGGHLCLSVAGAGADASVWGDDLARATVGSVRLKLLKVAARVRVSVRRV